MVHRFPYVTGTIDNAVNDNSFCDDLIDDSIIFNDNLTA